MKLIAPLIPAPPSSLSGLALVLAVAAAAALAVAPAGAQQCQAPAGGPACEAAGGIASLGDPDGGDLTVGNPIHPITGNKYQEEVDAPPLPGFLGLEIRRHYNAGYVAADSPWGRGWALSFDTRLYRHGSTLQIVQADGRRLVFGLPAAEDTPGRALAGAACLPAAPGQGELFIEPEGYRWLWPQHRELLFDLNGNLTQVRPRGGTRAEAIGIERGADGRISRVTDPGGRTMAISYDRNGYLSRIDHPLGRWHYRIDANGRLESVTAPDGVVRRYRHDDPGHPARFTSIAVEPPDEAPRVVGHWFHDAQGRVVRYRRADGGELHMAYQAEPVAPGSGRTVSVLTNALGARTRFEAVEAAGKWRITEITGPGCEECGPGNLRMRYDSRGQLAARERIGGPGLAYERDLQGRVVRIRLIGRGRAGAGYLLRFEYGDHRTHLPRLIARPSVVPGKEHRVLLERDDRGNLLRYLETGYAPGSNGDIADLHPLARRFDFRYQEVAGRKVLREIDGPLANGAAADPADSDITRFSYDEGSGLLQAVEAPGGFVRRVALRDAAGRAVRIVASDGHREVEEGFAYDYRGRILRSDAVAWLLDSQRRRIRESAVAAGTSQRFDALGRLARSIDAAGRSVDYRHDAVGRLQGSSDARGYRSELTRDAEGKLRIAALYQPGLDEPLRAAYYGRDRDGRLEALLLPDGRRFDFHYDIHGSVIGFSDAHRLLRLALPPDRLIESDAVDDFGQVLRQSLPDHGVRRMRYDDAGRLVGLVDAAGKRFTFRHDVADRLLSRSVDGAGDGGSASFTFEGRQLVGVDDPEQSTRWRRDAAGRVVETRIALKGLPGPPMRLATAYDAVTGLIVGHGLADGSTIRIRRLAIDEGGGPRQLDLRSAFWSEAARLLERRLPEELARRITALLPRTVVARDIDVHPFDGLAAFTYGNGSVMRRTIDPAGRTVRLVSGPPGQPVAHWRYRYGSGTRMKSIEDLADSSRAGAGSTLWRPPTEEGGAPRSGLVHDRAGRLVSDGRFRYTYTALGQVETVTDQQRERLVAAYAYNYRGQRIRKTVQASAGGVASVVHYLWNENRLAAEVALDGTITAQYLGLDDGRRSLPVAKLQPAAPRVRGAGHALLAVHSDHRGAPVAMTDARQRPLWRAALEAAGRAGRIVAARGVEMNLRLPGQYHDAETGLHDNWHRTYDPARGRYLQPDPLGYPDGPDAYVYAGGDPVNRVDPLGLYEIDVHYYMTFFLSVTAGLAPQEARIVALAAQYVDDNPLTRPMDSRHVGTAVGSVLHNQRQLLNYHFVLSGSDGRTLPEYRNDRLGVEDSPQLRNLLSAAGNIGLGRNARLQFLGEYLHALADTYSHRDPRNVPYDALVLGCGVGHGHDLHEPDLTYDALPVATGVAGRPPVRAVWRREARTLAMELDLHGVLLAVGEPSRARTAAEIESTLRAFNAIRESERGAASDFAGKIALLQKELVRLGYGEIDLVSLANYGYDVERAALNRREFLVGPSGQPLTEEAFPGVCLEGGTRCAKD